MPKLCCDVFLITGELQRDADILTGYLNILDGAEGYDITAITGISDCF